MAGAGSLNVANSFPLPIGVTISFSNGSAYPSSRHWTLISGLYVTRNFTLSDRGLWTMTINVSDAGDNNDQIVLNQVASGTDGSFDGTNTAIITCAQSGYYSVFVPQGGARYNFSTVNPIKMAALTLATSGVMGP